MEPKLIAASVERGAVTHGLALEGRSFAISILARSERALVRKFVKPVSENDVDVDEDKGTGTMRQVPVTTASTGAPVLCGALAFIDCEVRHVVELGSHSLFVGEVVDCGYLAPVNALEESGEPEAGSMTVLRMEDTKMNYGG
jgi:flavin reductase